MKAAARLAALTGLLGLGGCTTLQIYDGARREAHEVARISGDLRVRAGAPVSVILRQVDGRTLDVNQNSVEVLPGTHTFLVDCRIEETSSLTRHSIKADVSAGRRYRLIAETGPGLRECTEVRLDSVNSRL
jgi:hypothetical protein